MTKFDLPRYPTRHGYMSEKIQLDYIVAAVEKKLLPVDAHRMPEIVSLTAPSDVSKPILRVSISVPFGRTGLESKFSSDLWKIT